MLWLIILALVVAGVFTANRKVFAIGFFVLFVAVGVQRTAGDIDVIVGTDFQGDDVVRTTEPCGTAVGLLVGDAGDALTPSLRNACEKEARTRVFEALGALTVGALGAVVGWMLIPRLRPTPIDEVLNPLPKGDDSGVTGRPR